MSRLLNLWPLVCCACVAATPFKEAYLAEDTPQSNLKLLIPLKLGDDQELSPNERGPDYSRPQELTFESDGPYSQIPAEFFHQDGVVHALTQSPDQKTVKKDLSRFESVTFPQSTSLRQKLAEDRSIFPYATKANDEDSIARCEQFLYKSRSGDKEPDYNHLLKNLCLLHLQLRTNEPSGKVDKHFETHGKSDGFGWDSNGEMGRNVLANLLGGGFNQAGGNFGGNDFGMNDNKRTGKLGNFALNGYGGYAGNLGVGGKGQYVGNVGLGGKGGVYGNLGIGGQGALFGNLGIGGKGGEIDNAAFVNDDWTTNYQNLLLEALLQGNGLGHEGNKNNEHSQHKPEFSGAEDKLNSNNLVTDGNEAVIAHAGRGGVFADTVPQRVKPLSYPRSVRQRAIARDSSGSYDDDCALRSYLFNGKGGLVGNMAVDNYSVDNSLAKTNPCIRVYEINLIVDKKLKKSKHKKHSSSARYVVPLNWFRPINGRREWTSLGGYDQKKPLLVV